MDGLKINGNKDKENTKKPENEIESSREESKSGKKSSIIKTLSARNIRVAVVGNVDEGKSTLIGMLTTSCLDEGRRRSQTTIMKHQHKIESGRTSTATTYLMGFCHTGEPIAGRDSIRINKTKI